jgi:hypothetical protein
MTPSRDRNDINIAGAVEIDVDEPPDESAVMTFIDDQSRG